MITYITRLVLLGRILYWWIVFCVAWWMLTGGQGWLFGLVTALLAAGLAVKLTLRPICLNPLYLPHFVFFFVLEVALGAWDVARRALHPHVPANSALVVYPLRCQDPRVRLLLSAMVGLLPGTWASHFDEQHLHLHVLDEQSSWRTSVANMERQLIRLLGARPA